jgi:hypothetical protein
LIVTNRSGAALEGQGELFQSGQYEKIFFRSLLRTPGSTDGMLLPRPSFRRDPGNVVWSALVIRRHRTVPTCRPASRKSGQAAEGAWAISSSMTASSLTAVFITTKRPQAAAIERRLLDCAPIIVLLLLICQPVLRARHVVYMGARVPVSPRSMERMKMPRQTRRGLKIIKSYKVLV